MKSAARIVQLFIAISNRMGNHPILFLIGEAPGFNYFPEIFTGLAYPLMLLECKRRMVHFQDNPLSSHML